MRQRQKDHCTQFTNQDKINKNKRLHLILKQRFMTTWIEELSFDFTINEKLTKKRKKDINVHNYKKLK